MYKAEIDYISTASSKSDVSAESIFNFWQITPAKDGNLIAIENNIRLHSSYNPVREATQFANQNDISQKKSVIFLGFGLGYSVNELSKIILEKKDGIKTKKLILIEPDPIHFFAALYYLDWSNVFKIDQLIMAIGCPVNSLMSLIENSSSINTGHDGVSAAFIAANQAFMNHSMEYFAQVQDLIARNKRKNEINGATYNKFARLWIKNSFSNLHHIKSLRKVQDLKKSFANKDFPFVLVAAGPSLQKILPQLNELKKHAYIVCVETALRALLKEKIEPDFIILSDPQYWAYRHIAGLKSPSSILITEISVFPPAFRFECKEIVLSSSLFPIGEFFENKAGSFGSLGAGGSVATAAWNFCYEMGAKKIFTAGMDLSFPAKETHIKGSSGEQTMHSVSSRLASVEKQSSSSIFGANAEYAFDYKNNCVQTDSRMKMFAWWFESRLSECTETKTFTLCSESMKIPGIEYSEEENEWLLSSAPELSESDRHFESAQEKYINFDADYSDFEKNLNNLSALINKAVELCLINSLDVEERLADVEREIGENPLLEIIKLARPSEKYLETHKTEPKELAVYTKLQEELKTYIHFMKKFHL